MSLTLASLAGRVTELGTRTPAEWFDLFQAGAENTAGDEWDDRALDYLALLHLLPDDLFHEFWAELPATLQAALSNPDHQLDRMLKNAPRDMGIIFSRMDEEDRNQCRQSMSAITGMIESRQDAAAIMTTCRELLLHDMVDDEEDTPDSDDDEEKYPDDPEDYHWGESESLATFWVVLDKEVIDYLPALALIKDWLHGRPIPADLAEEITGSIDLEEIGSPPAGGMEAALVASSLRHLNETCRNYTQP
ncbi:hypothetical protein GC177_01915 [bacterium]|nr:hypothetical protein [bacterium]